VKSAGCRTTPNHDRGAGSEVDPIDLPRCDRVGYRVLDHRDGHLFPVADPRQQVVLGDPSDAALLNGRGVAGDVWRARRPSCG
jgi:hypothetical protein